MSGWKKLAAASAAGGEALNVEDVFSTYLYTGNSASQPIDNGVDLAGEGGMVWLKARTAAYNNIIVDSERGSSNGTAFNPLFTNLTNAENTAAGYGVTSFDDDGFTLGPSSQQPISNQGGASYGDIDYASWAWRKAPKFFDTVTYTGNGSSQNISHNLGSVPGMIIVKATSVVANWAVWHRESNASPEYKHLQLNTTGAALTSGTVWNSTNPTDSVFSVGNYYNTNNSGTTYVAYLFAHNDGDGEFGPDGDADIIKCGSYTGAGYGAADEFNVDLGFEPQWILYKRADNSAGGGWFMVDNMRGWRPETSSNFEYLQAQSSDAESQSGSLGIRSDGFRVREGLGRKYIYMAIRRGTKVPESATEVFAIDTKNTPEPAYDSGFPVDMAIQRNISVATSNTVATRLIQKKRLLTDGTNAEENSTTFMFDYNTGYSSDASNNASVYSWMWKRAPGFFDVVCYDGDATASPNSRDIEHNLGVAPEMMWIKCRSFAENWAVYHSGIGATKYLNLNGNAAAATSANWWRNTAPTDTVFTIGHQDDVNANGQTHIAYLFASLSGISKVGSYTGNGTNQNIDCGFTSGARFVLIKPTTAGNSWYLFDSTRGIVAGNDPFLLINTTNAEITSADYIDPYSGGFNVTGGPGTVNQSGVEHIFYAIA
jgi:hypothetical protein